MHLSLAEAGITNVIWATGYSADFSFLGDDAMKEGWDARTSLPDDIASPAVPGLFFSGFPWIGTQQSVNIVNFDHDHKIIVDSLRT